MAVFSLTLVALCRYPQYDKMDVCGSTMSMNSIAFELERKRMQLCACVTVYANKHANKSMSQSLLKT